MLQRIPSSLLVVAGLGSLALASCTQTQTTTDTICCVSFPMTRPVSLKLTQRLHKQAQRI